MSRLRDLTAGGMLLAPMSWATGDDTDAAALIVIHRVKDGTEADFRVSIVNSNAGSIGGIDYHPVKVDPSDGSLLRCVVLDIKNILNQKILNTAFW